MCEDFIKHFSGSPFIHFSFFLYFRNNLMNSLITMFGEVEFGIAFEKLLMKS